MTAMTELHQAAAAGDCDLVEDLVKSKRFNPNQKDVDWKCRTPLHWAAAQGQTEMVRVLIEHGARPCLRTDSGWTPGHFAAESGRLWVLRLLHSVHAPIDAEDCSGDRPIRIAEIYGHKDCVEFLKIAEEECRAHRQKAKLKGLALDETDEEWEEYNKDMDRNRWRQSHRKQAPCHLKGKGKMQSVNAHGRAEVPNFRAMNR